MTNHVDFTPEKLAQLKKVYDQAVLAGKDRFDFEGHPLLVSYAKYVIQYLDTKFKKEK